MLNQAALKALKPRDKRYTVADGGGLYIEVMPGGAMTWRMEYRLAGRKGRVTLGSFPEFGLADARRWREDTRAAVARGEDPAMAKRREKMGQTVKALAEGWYQAYVLVNRRNPAEVRRHLDLYILPELGRIRLADLTQRDVFALVHRIAEKEKHPTMAAHVLRTVKQCLNYAVGQGIIEQSPAARIRQRLVAQSKPRERALTPAEIGIVLRTVYAASNRTVERSLKLAAHLLLVTMTRKAELIGARWDEIDLAKGEWTIPAARMKMGRDHFVPLAPEAVELFRELRDLAVPKDSPWVFPGTGDIPIHHDRLNRALRRLDYPGVEPFVVHDFRRTASTILHDAGWPSDAIEKALAHSIGGMRGVYNRAEFKAQRRDMLCAWARMVADFIEGRDNVLQVHFGAAGAMGAG